MIDTRLTVKWHRRRKPDTQRIGSSKFFVRVQSPIGCFRSIVNRVPIWRAVCTQKRYENYRTPSQIDFPTDTLSFIKSTTFVDQGCDIDDPITALYIHKYSYRQSFSRQNLFSRFPFNCAADVLKLPRSSFQILLNITKKQCLDTVAYIHVSPPRSVGGRGTDRNYCQLLPISIHLYAPSICLSVSKTRLALTEKLFPTKKKSILAYESNFLLLLSRDIPTVWLVQNSTLRH